MSDKYDEVAERIQASIDEWIAGPKDDRTFAGITVAILREAFPAPSAQGEDERALAISRDGLLQLQLALNDAVNDIVGVFPPQTDIKKALIKAANDYINGVADYVAALRSRQPSALTGGTDGIIEEFERGRKAGHFGEAVEYPEPPTCPDCHGKGWYLEPREVGDTTAYERVNCHCIEEEEERAHEALRSRLAEPWSEADEELYKWAKAGNKAGPVQAEEQDRKSYTDDQDRESYKPAQAAPNEERRDLAERLAKEIVEKVRGYVENWRSAPLLDEQIYDVAEIMDRYCDDVVRAALASERAKREGEHDDEYFLIFYEDQDRRPEIHQGEAGARARFADVLDRWSAHLFRRVSPDSGPVNNTKKVKS